MNKRIFLLVLMGLHLFFFAMAMFFGGTRIADSYDFLFQAQNIAEQGSFYAWNFEEPIKPDYFTKRTPGYGVFLYLTGSTEWLVLLLQNAMSILLWYMVFGVLLRIGLDIKKAAALILLTLLFQGNVLIYANSIMTEVPFQLAIFIGFYCLLLDLLEEKKGAWLKACLAFSVALLLKPVLLYFWMPLLILAIIRAKQLRTFRVIWPVALLPIVILLWSAYNHKITGWNHYTSLSAVNLKDYNARLMLESRYGVPYADSVIADINTQADEQANYAERNGFIIQACKKLISDNKVAYAKVHLKGMVAMLIDPGRFDYVQFFKLPAGEDGLMYKLARGDFQGMLITLKQQSALIVFIFLFNLLGSILLILLSIRGLIAWKKAPFMVFILVMIIGYFWVLTGPVGTARYKSAVLPFLCLLCGLGFLPSKNKRFL